MRGDWPRRLLATSQLLVGGVALVGIVAWTTLNPTMLLAFLFLQPALLLGVVLFVVAGLSGRKALLPERFAAGTTVHHAGSGSDVVWVVQRGTLETIRADGAVVARLGPGDHFGGDAAAPAGELPLGLRAVTDAALLRINAGDLAGLVAHVPGLRERIGDLLHDGTAHGGSAHHRHRRSAGR